MPAPPRRDQGGQALVMHLSVPAEGGLRGIASELATRIAEHLGAAAAEAESIGALVDRLAASLGNAGGAEGRVITFEFREVDGELVVQGRCNGNASEVRHQLSS